MNSIELLRRSFDDVHRVFREDMATLDAETLWWRPAPSMNTVGFLLWHVLRDEDVVLSYQGKRPQVWVAEAWAARLGLPDEPQGTGMDPLEAADLRYDLEMLNEYAERVWEQTKSVFATLAPQRLLLPAWRGSDWTVATQLVEGCLGHSWLHLGEIRCTRGLRGWRGPE